MNWICFRKRFYLFMSPLSFFGTMVICTFLGKVKEIQSVANGRTSLIFQTIQQYRKIFKTYVVVDDSELRVNYINQTFQKYSEVKIHPHLDLLTRYLSFLLHLIILLHLLILLKRDWNAIRRHLKFMKPRTRLSEKWRLGFPSQIPSERPVDTDRHSISGRR